MTHYYALGVHLPNGRMWSLNLPEYSASATISGFKVMPGPTEFDPERPDVRVWESDRTQMVEKIVKRYSAILEFVCGFGYAEDSIVLWCWDTSLGSFDEINWASNGWPLWVAFRHRKSGEYLAGTNFSYDKRENMPIFASRNVAPMIFPGRNIDWEMKNRNISFSEWEMVDVSDWFMQR